MNTFIKLYSNKTGEIYRFLEKFYNKENYIIPDSSVLEWEKHFSNPIEMASIIGVFIDNKDKFNINLWISLDKDLLINVTENNVNDVITYLYERFPY